MIAPKLLLITSLLSYVTVNAQNVDVISDVENSRVIQPGQQSAEANLRHQNFCQTIGGIDSTNEATVTLLGDAKDVISCDMPIGSTPKAGIIPINKDDSTGKFIPNVDFQQLDKLVPGLVSLVAPSGSVQYQQNFYAIGTAGYYHNLNPGILLGTISTMSIPQDNCSGRIQKDMNWGDTYEAKITVLCNAMAVGAIPTQMQGCTFVEGSGNPPGCSSALDTVYQTKP